MRSRAVGFCPLDAEWYDEALLLDAAFYVNYAMTETNVAHAIRRGEDEAAIREWCRFSLEPVFASRPQHIVFTGYIAYFSKL